MKNELIGLFAQNMVKMIKLDLHELLFHLTEIQIKSGNTSDLSACIHDVKSQLIWHNRNGTLCIEKATMILAIVYNAITGEDNFKHYSQKIE